MLSFIRYDLKKLFKMRALPIFFILTLLPPLILTTLDYHQGYGQSYDQYEASYDKQLKDYQASQAGNQEMEETGIYIQARHPGEKMDVDTYKAAQAEAKEALKIDESAFDTIIYLAPLAIVLFAIFIGNDFSSGFLKNLLTIKHARRNWLLSKIPTALVVGVLIFIFSLAFGFYTQLMVAIPMESLDWSGLFLQFILLEIYLLLTIFLASLIALLSQSKSLTLVLSLLIGSKIVHNLLATVGGYFDLNVNHFFFLRRMESLGLGAEKGMASLILMGVLYLIILFSLNLFRIKKMDFQFAS